MNTLSRPRQSLLLIAAILSCLQNQTSAQNNDQAPLDFSKGVIVLNDGRVFSGDITNVPGGYRVDSKGTYAIIPFGKVDVTAPSLNQAYLALRDRVLRPTAADHLQLAEWCLKNELVGQARSEVIKALTLEPLRPEARVLMIQIDERLNPKKEKVKLPTQTAMTIDGFLRTKQNNSGGINRQSHQVFIRQIQPIMMNKCGNAYCHGEAAKNEFRLARIQRGASGNRLQSQHNLEQALKFIDREDPSQSKLLLIDAGSQAVHQKVFLGAKGNLQHKRLSAWIAAVAGKPLRSLQTAPTLATLPQQPSSKKIQLVSGETAARDSSTLPSEKAILGTARAQSQPDPFDPEVFNRRVHGATAGKLRERGASGAIQKQE